MIGKRQQRNDIIIYDVAFTPLLLFLRNQHIFIVNIMRLNKMGIHFTIE